MVTRPSRLLALGLIVLAAACAAVSRTTPSTPTALVEVPPGSWPPDAAKATPDGPLTAPARPALVEGVADAAVDGSPLPSSSTASAETPDATPDLSAAKAASASACNDQPPQEFLVRANFLKGGTEALRRAIQYRTDTYGYFKGFGRAPADALPPSSSVVPTTFMDLPVKMHRKVVPALKCVEVEIKQACSGHRYTPQALAGIRFRNTYRGGEVTNHIYGIAIDVDPARNTCCGCVPPWNDAPACKRPAKTEYDRMDMPECWVHAFERYGFYWLGHDRLRDTMHFEFLGDPDRIAKSNPPGQ